MTSSVQSLESRRLLAAKLSGNTLSVTGTPAGEAIVFTSDLSQDRVTVQIGPDPASAETFTLSDVLRIRVFADDGNDIVQFINIFEAAITVYGGAGDDRVDAGNLRRIRAYGEDGLDVLRITGSSRDTLYGGEGNDTIGSNGGRDYLSGDGGDDNLNGGGLNDTLFGGPGNDQLNGGISDPFGAEAKDFISGGSGDDNINGGFGNDTLLGDDGNDQIYGGSERDSINGGDGADTLRGEGGHDTLLGGPMTDQIFGGPDQDGFVTAERVAGEVQDFTVGEDRDL